MHKILYCLLTAILGLAGVSSLTSCYDDKGNYNYIDLDEVVIDTTGCGIQSAYSVGRYDHLTLGFAPALDADITTVAGTYRLQLTVTQRDTGVQTYLQLSCQVEESITAGWMLLYERADQPGTSDVGLVVNTLVKKNITAAQEREFWNLYSASNQEPIAGTPVRIFRMVNDMGGGTDPVTCLTTEDLVNVNNATFEKTVDFADFFYASRLPSGMALRVEAREDASSSMTMPSIRSTTCTPPAEETTWATRLRPTSENWPHGEAMCQTVARPWSLTRQTDVSIISCNTRHKSPPLKHKVRQRDLMSTMSTPPSRQATGDEATAMQALHTTIC